MIETTVLAGVMALALHKLSKTKTCENLNVSSEVKKLSNYAEYACIVLGIMTVFF